MHKIQLPRTILVGPGAISKVGETCKELGLRHNTLVVCATSIYKNIGRPVVRDLKNSGFRSRRIFVDEATEEMVSEVRAAIAKEKSAFVCGIGGGTAIDVAKLASAQSKLPFLSIPTACSNDGIANSRASIRTADNQKTSIEAQAPLAIIADSVIIQQAPHRFFAAGFGDMVAKFTANLDWQLAHRLKGEYYGAYASQLAMMSAKMMIDNAEYISKHYEEGINMLIEALISAGVAMSIAGSTRPCSGSEHLFSHALETIAAKPALHGEQCGVGTIMMAHLHGQDWRKIQTALRLIGSPTNAMELGVTEEEVIGALMKAHSIRPDRYTILGDGLTREAAEKLAKDTEVI